MKTMSDAKVIQAFVREHGAGQVLSAIFDTAEALYGESRGRDKVLDLVEVMAHQRTTRPAPTCACPADECLDAGAPGCYFGVMPDRVSRPGETGS